MVVHASLSAVPSVRVIVAVDDAPQAMLSILSEFGARCLPELFRKVRSANSAVVVWRNLVVDSSGACGNQLGIERIVLGASQMHSRTPCRIGCSTADEPAARKRSPHRVRPPVASIPNASRALVNLRPKRPARQGVETCQRSVRPERRRLVCLGCIDSSRRYSLVIFLDLCLVKRTVFRQPSGR